MKIVLISTYMQPLALGMRYVSAFLKKSGHQVSCLFMGSEKESEQVVSPALCDDFVDHCRGADVVGFSLMTNSFFRSCAMTEYLRRAGIKAPIVWGGTHPTVAPRESAEHADYICVGEGEKAMVEFLDNLQAGRDPAQTRGFACLRNGGLVCNPVYPLCDDLDEYPFPDYDGDNHWVVQKDRLVEAGPKQIGRILRRYRMSSTRGCPFSCAFCNNATQLNIYREAGFAKHWVRKRSTPSIIAELEAILARYPSITAVNLIDDLFLIRNEQEIEAFVEAYVNRVNLPIEIDAFPNTVTEEKIRIISRLPIELLSMGIQSGSQSMLKDLYNRPTP
ncbi:MAG: B12-binding domain-containing radical SAM protein, partial [Phycisphaerales bacterium]|nr:B12-binding domain-containing radical SAM protein [Phycisphaerales bacterium]